MSANRTLKSAAAVSVGALALGALAATSATAAGPAEPRQMTAPAAERDGGNGHNGGNDHNGGGGNGRDGGNGHNGGGGGNGHNGGSGGNGEDRGRHYDPKGKVVSDIGLNVRAYPSTRAQKVGFVPSGKIIELKCKKIGENVRGNKRWYKLDKHDGGWVAARYVKNLDHVPWC
ncbi:hypothetical protein GCM10027168_14510 [Streptomyces capparidis]